MPEGRDDPRKLRASEILGLGVLVSIGTVLRLAAIAALVGFSTPPDTGSDSQEYDTYAWNVAQGRGYRGMSSDVTDQDHFTAYRPPLTPLYYAGIYSVFGHNYPAAHVVDSMLSALSCVLIFLIADACLGRREAWLSAIAYTFYPMAIFFNMTLLSETTAVFMMTGFVLALIRWDRAATWGRAAVSGVALGLLLLCKPGCVFLLPILVLAGLILYGFDRARWTQFLAVFLIGAVMLSPWVVRNYLTMKRFIPFSTLGGAMLAMSYNRIVVEDPALYGYCVLDNAIPEYIDAIKAPDDEFLRDEQAKRFGLEWIKANPDKLPYLVRWRLVRYFMPWGLGGGFAQRLAMYVPYGLALFFGLIAAGPLLRRFVREKNPGLFMIACFVSGLASGLAFFGQHRYRFPTDWILVVMGSYGLTMVYDAIRAGRSPIPLPGLSLRNAAVAAALVLVAAGWYVDDARIETFRAETCRGRRDAVANAVARFQADQGRPPKDLAELLPRYLPNVEALHCPKHSIDWHDYILFSKTDASQAKGLISYQLAPGDSPGSVAVSEIKDRHRGTLPPTPVPPKK